MLASGCQKVLQCAVTSDVDEETPVSVTPNEEASVAVTSEDPTGTCNFFHLFEKYN